jgi:phosphatidylglycerophosphatase A
MKAPTLDARLSSRLGLLLLTGFGLGRLPLAPGTLGSLLPAGAALLMAQSGAPAAVIDAGMALTATLFGWACIHFGALAERTFGREDPSQVVADEIAGQAVVLLLLPWRPADAPDSLLWNSAWAGCAFLLFRVFDILKPGPIRTMQNLSGGSGVLADDLLAAVFAGALLQGAVVAIRASA